MIDRAVGLEQETDCQSCYTPSSDSRRLWSLWDMLAQYAWEFFILSRLLEKLHAELGVPLPKALEQPTGSVNALRALQGLGSLGLAAQYTPPLTAPLPDTLTEDQRQRIPSLLELLKGCCKQIDVVGIGNEIDRAIKYVNAAYATRERAQFHIEHITDRIIDEVREQSFLHVKKDRKHYYMNPSLFGEDIDRKFSKVAEDIGNAGNCFALRQYTASVFHIMRVMEYCVQRFGKKLHIPIDVKNETWYQIMDQVNSSVKRLPGGKNATASQNKRKERYAMAAGRLDHVRIVWRNPVMHPKDTYDENQALEVLDGVGKYLESIVKLV